MSNPLAHDLRLALSPAEFADTLGPPLYPWQREFVESPERQKILVCSRQAGKSRTTRILALHRCLYRPGSLVIVVAGALRQSRQFFEGVKPLYALLEDPPTDLLNPGADEELQFGNGSRLVCLPGKAETIRSYSDASLLVIDEGRSVARDTYVSVRPFLAASSGDLAILSSAGFEGHWLHAEWFGEGSFARWCVTADQVPHITAAYLADEKASLTREEFEREFGCCWGQAESRVFDAGLVDGLFDDPEVRPLLDPFGFGGDQACTN